MAVLPISKLINVFTMREEPLIGKVADYRTETITELANLSFPFLQEPKSQKHMFKREV